MKFLLKLLKKHEHHFQKGGRFSFLYPLWDAQETFFFTPDEVTSNGPHIRDSIDLKRLMVTIMLALVPLTLFGIYNAGWQSARALGILGELSQIQIFLNGAWVVLPIIIVSYGTGIFWETLFGSIRKHKISEGFLQTGILFPLTLPPTIPLWQVAIGVSFGVVIGKEIFGGTGMNVLNPALTARAFLFFSFPVDISGADPWVVTEVSRLLFSGSVPALIDGFSGATPLLRLFEEGVTSPITAYIAATPLHDYSFMNMFIGLIPGSIGETSALLILIGALILIVSGTGSWRIMLGVFAGAILTIEGIHLFAGPESAPAFHLPFYYHFVMGGFLFGAIFMATDPVSASATRTGKYIYGACIGVITILVRLFNPAYPEGIMLAILFMNLFAPLIDHYVIQGHIKRRLRRAKTGG